MTDRTAQVWYCGIAGRRNGPMSLDDLQQMVDRGELIGSDLLWCPDFGDSWRAAETVGELDFSRQPEGMARAEPPPMGQRPEPEEPIIMPSTPLTGMEGSEPSAREAGRRAWRRMKTILFQPFSFTRWCGIALAAWLAGIGSGGINFRGDPSEFKKAFSDMASDIDANGIPNIPGAISDTLSNLNLGNASALLVSIVAMTIVFSIVIAVVLCWVRARATFALLHKVHRPDATWGEAWAIGQSGGIAKSLFLWRLCIGIVFVACTAPLGIVAFFAITKAVASAEPGGFIMVLPTVLLWSLLVMLAGATYGLFMSLTRQFMEPIMYWRQIGARQAWKVMNEFCSQCAGAVFRYYVMLFVWGIAAAFAILGAVICTLSIFFWLLIIPFVGSLELLPITIFFRSTGIEMLRWRLARCGSASGSSG